MDELLSGLDLEAMRSSFASHPPFTAEQKTPTPGTSVLGQQSIEGHSCLLSLTGIEGC